MPPDTPGRLAWKIVARPGTIPEKRERLGELARQHPDDMGVLGYFESLAMQEDLEQHARESG
jgi:hypothetical protein